MTQRLAHLRSRHSRLARWATGGVGFFVLAQALALQLLCFCGTCPLSLALGVGADSSRPVHACCLRAQARAAAQPHVTADTSCCDADHAPTAGLTLLPDALGQEPSPLPPAWVVANVALPPAALGLAFAAALPRPRSRAPPGFPAPVYLTTSSLLI